MSEFGERFMMNEQKKARTKETVCKYCKRPAMLIQVETGKWILCEREKTRFSPLVSDDPEATHSFAVEDGRVFRGKADEQGCMTGYRKHITNCRIKN